MVPFVALLTSRFLVTTLKDLFARRFKELIGAAVLQRRNLRMESVQVARKKGLQ